MTEAVIAMIRLEGVDPLRARTLRRWRRSRSNSNPRTPGPFEDPKSSEPIAVWWAGELRWGFCLKCAGRSTNGLALLLPRTIVEQQSRTHRS
jgi:hypothetical protein